MSRVFFFRSAAFWCDTVFPDSYRINLDNYSPIGRRDALSLTAFKPISYKDIILQIINVCPMYHLSVQYATGNNLSDEAAKLAASVSTSADETPHFPRTISFL